METEASEVVVPMYELENEDGKRIFRETLRWDILSQWGFASLQADR